jgi:hypothetical protein
MQDPYSQSVDTRQVSPLSFAWAFEEHRFGQTSRALICNAGKNILGQNIVIDGESTRPREDVFSLSAFFSHHFFAKINRKLPERISTSYDERGG